MNSPKAMKGKARHPKRLLFDKRYGWVFDELKDPKEEALAGGRGMFCILPLAKGVIDIASQSINFAAGSLIKVIQQRDQFSPQALKTKLNDEFQKLMCSVQRPNLNLSVLRGNSSILSFSSFQQVHQENSDSQNS
ncbi:hypothetical protein AAC387_Pa07g1334 [Persea americana]